MPLRLRHKEDFQFQYLGFSAISGRPSLNAAHRHDDLELAVNEHAAGVALFGGQKVTFIPEHLVVMWGAMPHKPLTVDPACLVYGIRVPMPWVLQWKLPDALIRRLLNFDVIVDCRRQSPCSDLALLKNWVLLMQSGRREDREIVLLEVHARLLRLAATMVTTADQSPVDTTEPRVLQTPECGLFEQILRIVSERYREALSIPDIARELRVSRTHVMRQFRKIAGLTVLEYVTQRRVSCAQRLMITTDENILDIALASGFGSLAQFYACFKRIVGQSPARYRRALRQ